MMTEPRAIWDPETTMFVVFLVVMGVWAAANLYGRWRAR